MHKYYQRLWLLALCSTLTACAGVDYRAIESDIDDKSNQGIRYYQASPYLLIMPNPSGGITASIRYFPDPTKKMSLKPYAYSSSLKTTFTFDKGILGNSKEVVDTTAVPKAVLDAIKNAAGTYQGMFNDLNKGDPVGTEYSIPPPSIYKIVMDSYGQIFLVGGTPDEQIKISVIPQKAE